GPLPDELGQLADRDAVAEADVDVDLVAVGEEPDRQPPHGRSPSSTRSSRVTSRVPRAYSTSRTLRFEANCPRSPRMPRTPLAASLWQTWSSLRLNLRRVQPRRRAASNDDGMAAAERPAPASAGSASTRTSRS